MFSDNRQGSEILLRPLANERRFILLPFIQIIACMVYIHAHSLRATRGNALVPCSSPLCNNLKTRKDTHSIPRARVAYALRLPFLSLPSLLPFCAPPPPLLCRVLCTCILL
jgi:hypothetical protein